MLLAARPAAVTIRGTCRPVAKPSRVRLTMPPSGRRSKSCAGRRPDSGEVGGAGRHGVQPHRRAGARRHRLALQHAAARRPRARGRARPPFRANPAREVQGKELTRDELGNTRDAALARFEGMERSSDFFHLAPRPILHLTVCQTKNAKTPQMRGFRPIAGARFEPATFGL